MRPLPATVLLLCGALLASPVSLARGDRLNGFDLRNASVPRRLIRQGGPPRDGIPSIDRPRFVPALQAGLSDDDRVLGVVLHGVARAYPIRILNYHEIVNDRFVDTPVAVTFCPLCGSGIAFLAKLDDRPLQFGVSGLLYNSDVLMYDRQGESLWSQIAGQAITGPARGRRLATIPVRHTTWARWRARHPDSLVLRPPRSFGRNYDVDPYLGYADSSRIWAPVAYRDHRFPAKAVVAGVVINGQAMAWPFRELPPDGHALDATVGGQPVRLEYDVATHSAAVLDGDGKPLSSVTAYWFAWVAFHPDTAVYRRGDPAG